MKIRINLSCFGRTSRLTVLTYTVLLLLPALCWPTDATPSSPYMLFDTSDIPTIRQKMQSLPYKTFYDALDKRAALRWIVDSDENAVKEIKAWAYNGLITARANMKPGNQFNWGPFQWGRRVQEWTIPMDMVISSSLFSDTEKQALRLACDSIAYRLRDPTYIEYGLQNRTLDQAIGVAFAGVFMFPDNPNAADHLQYVQKEIERHLKFVQQDGSWPETTRYVGLVVLKCFTLYSRVLRNYNGTDLTKDPRYQSMFRKHMEIITPRDALNGNLSVAPGIGDAGWIIGEYATLGYGAGELANTNPELSKALYTFWVRAGSPWLTPNNQLLYVDLNVKPDPSITLNNVFQQNVGYYLFRQYFDTEKERYLIAKNAKIMLEHRHFDAGSFSIYSDNTPLMLDPGICDYASPELSAFKSTQRHNLVAFKTGSSFVDGAHFGKLLDTVQSPEIDMVKFDLATASAQLYHRTIATVKNGIDAYVVYDCIEGTNPSSNNFHVLSKSTQTTVSDGITKSVSDCYNNMNTEILNLLPQNATIRKSKSKVGECPPAWPRNLSNASDTNDRKNVYQEWLSVDNQAGGDYLSIIYPVRTGTKSCSAQRLNTTTPHAYCFRVTTADGWFIAVVNDTTTSQQIDIPFDSALVNMATKMIYQSINNNVAVAINPTSLMILAPETQIKTVRKLSSISNPTFQVIVQNRAVLITIPATSLTRGSLKICTPNGKIIPVTETARMVNPSQWSFSISHLCSGVYLVRYENESSMISRMIVVP